MKKKENKKLPKWLSDMLAWDNLKHYVYSAFVIIPLAAFTNFLGPPWF